MLDSLECGAIVTTAVIPFYQGKAGTAFYNATTKKRIIVLSELKQDIVSQRGNRHYLFEDFFLNASTKINII